MKSPDPEHQGYDFQIDSVHPGNGKKSEDGDEEEGDSEDTHQENKLGNSCEYPATHSSTDVSCTQIA